MHIHRGRLNWGVFLITLGAVALAVYTGALDAATASTLARLWPLILIAIGVGLLLRFTPIAALGGIIVAATLGLVLGALLAGGAAGVAGACLTAVGREPGVLETRSSPFAGQQARLEVELSCTDLTVDRAGGNEWIVRAEFSNGQPTLDSQPERLVLRDRGGFFNTRAASRVVQVSLPDAPATTADLTLNASAAEIDLGGAPLDRLSATLNASDATIRLTETQLSGPINVSLNASAATLLLPRSGTQQAGALSLNAASLTLCAPPELGLRVTLDQRLSADDFGAAGLERDGDAWQTPGFDGAAAQAMLNISANVSSISLDRSGGCS